MIAAISTRELSDRSTGHQAIVDVRPVAAYNGWRLQGEARGGHVPGARSLPAEWTRYLDWTEIVEGKGLDPEQPIALYGYGAEAARAVAGQLERLGFRDIGVYDAFADQWSADPDRPLRRLERFRHLVHPGWLHGALQGARVEQPPRGNVVLCHAHFDNPADYHRGHIPGAVALDTNSLESPATWNRREPDELRAALRQLGICRDSTVVVYGRCSHPSYDQPHPGQQAGHLGAMRCALIMLYAGVEDVRVLNGGIHSWEAEGHKLSAETTSPSPAADFGIEIPAHPEYIVDLPEARQIIASPGAELVAITSWREYIGEFSGYHYIAKQGRIAGSVFGNCGSDAYHMENYRNLDHTTREFGEIERNWVAAGIVPEKRVAFYCGTGWRASEAFMNAWLMGWPRVSIFDGGWYEWSADPANPIATGAP
ncbi:MAG: thiosulfate sulfurtransferase [Gemmatimonadetes bacterium]|nr:thiosulfate sulfurtransferase [Gemmatimonadota bacterium]